MWEIERDFVDEHLQMHRFVLVNKALLDVKKQPARRTYDYLLGSGHDGQSCPHCKAAVVLGHTLHDDGAMRDRDGNVVTARARAEEHVKALNGQQNRVTSYLRRHRARSERVNK
jgi:hypothetical protein